MRKAVLRIALAAAVSLAGQAHAEDVPKGWKVLKESGGSCRIAIPESWKQQSLMGEPMGIANTADKKSSAAVNGVAMPFAQSKQMIVGSLKVEKVIEDSASRHFYEFSGIGAKPGNLNLYVAIKGPRGTCNAQVSVPKADAETGRKIAASLGAG